MITTTGSTQYDHISFNPAGRSTLSEQARSVFSAPMISVHCPGTRGSSITPAAFGSGCGRALRHHPLSQWPLVDHILTRLDDLMPFPSD